MEIEVNISVPDELLDSGGKKVSRKVFEQFVVVRLQEKKTDE